MPSLEKTAAFVYGAGGIYALYLAYGLLQEQIFSKNYAKEGAKSEKFYAPSLLVMGQCFTSFIIARLVNYDYPNRISEWDQLTMGACNGLSMLASNSALKFVSYPFQALMKSAKIMSIMLVSLVLGGKPHRVQEYVTAALITLGIVLFNLSEQKSTSDIQTSSIGVILLLASLFGDGVLADY